MPVDELPRNEKPSMILAMRVPGAEKSYLINVLTERGVAGVSEKLGSCKVHSLLKVESHVLIHE